MTQLNELQFIWFFYVLFIHYKIVYIAEPALHKLALK